MRPTGKLHLGNYRGALYNWVKLQEEYECYFFIADWHALTTDYENLTELRGNIYQVALDFLAAGLDPERSTIFVQSSVPDHAVLNVLLANITSLSWLERVPSYKDQQEQLREKDLATYGFLGYPLLQSADILLYQPHYVPVGLDQASHVELTREIAPGEVKISDFEHWAAPLGQTAVQVLAQDLAARLPAGALIPPAAPLPPGGLDVDVDILAFNVAGGQAVMQASWSEIARPSVADKGGQAPPPASSTRLVELTAPVDAAGGLAEAQGLSRLLGQLADRIAAAH